MGSIYLVSILAVIALGFIVMMIVDSSKKQIATA
jgi:hypothetical protein